MKPPFPHVSILTLFDKLLVYPRKMDNHETGASGFSTAGNAAFPLGPSPSMFRLSFPFTPNLVSSYHTVRPEVRKIHYCLYRRALNWYCSFTDWFCFMVLDIGNPDIDSIPLGTRFVAGLLQAIAVRAAGFGIVPLAGLAPAVKLG